MKYLLILSILLYSCNGDGWSEEKTYQSVRKMYPNAKIYHFGNSRTIDWVVIDTDGTYYKVETGKGSDASVKKVEKPIELK